MKPKSALRHILSIASSALLAISYTHAATLYWDGGTVDIATNGNGVSGGTAGNWDTTLLNWDQGANLPHVAWDNTNTIPNPADTAFFGGTAGTVTLTAPVTVGGLGFFSNSGYTIAAGSQGLTFGATTNQVRMVNVSGGTSTATLSGTVTSVSGGNLVFSSVAPDVSSTLTLSGTSTGGWSGTSAINPGFTLSLSGLNQALLNTSAITLNGGGITVTSADDVAQDDLDRINNSAGITSNGGTLTYTTTGAASTKVFNETIGSVTLTTGQLNLFNSLDKSAGSQTLALGGLTRSGATNTSAITFSNAGGLNPTTDRIRVNGITADTAGDEIIGTWATVGTAPSSQSDYAVYDSDLTDGYVVARNILASNESTWSTTTTATSNYTLANTSGSAVNGRLTATRNINSLRNTTATAAVTPDNATDLFTLVGHAFLADDVVVLGGTTAPAGLSLGVPYYVVNPVGDTFQVATTSGGAAILFTNNGTAVSISGGITLPTGFNLGTLGILNGSGATLAIGGNGAAVTLPSITAGNLHVTPGVGPIAIIAPITDNTGALTLVKGGNNVLTLSGTNTYTGGTVLNAGQLNIGNVSHIGGASANLTFGGTATLAPSAALNFSGGTLAINTGAYGTITGTGATAFATTTGAGSLRYTSGANTGSLNLGNASGFTGNLEFRLTGNAGYTAGGTASIQFSRLGDGVGSALQVGGGQADSTSPSQRANIVFNGSAPLVFDNRRIELLPRIASNHTVQTTTLYNNSTDAANTWVINTDLSYQVDQSRSIELAGGNTGDNAFNGLISDGNVGGVLSLRKDGAGRWIVSGSNTFSGSVSVIGGTLVLSGANSYTGATSVTGGTLVGIGANAFGSTSGISTTGTPTISLRGDSSTNFVKTSDSTPYTLTTSATGVTLNVDQATVAGSAAKTMTFGDITTSSVAATYQFNFTGANNTSLSVGTLTTPVSTIAASHTISNNISGGGSLTLASVNNRAGTVASPDLIFNGTGTTIVTGAITQTLADMDLVKNGAGTLILNGINTYTGLTSVNAGTLGGSGTIAGNVTVAAAANLAPGGTAGTLSIGGDLSISAMAGGAGTASFELGPIAASDKIAVTGTLTIGSGTLGFGDFNFSPLVGLQNGTYKLITSGAPVSGTLDTDPLNLTGSVGAGSGTLQITGNDLELVVTGVGGLTGYALWASVNATSGDPDDDFDGDGVSNAAEFVLGGLASTNDLGKLPAVATGSGNLTFTFVRDQASIAPAATVTVEVGTTLASWPTPFTVGADTAGSTAGVVVTKDSPSVGKDTVVLTVVQSPDTKKFARLKVVITP